MRRAASAGAAGLCASLSAAIGAQGIPTVVFTSDAGIGDRVGSSVAVWGIMAVAGAPYDDDAGTDVGAVHLLTRGCSEWIGGDKLVLDGLQPGDAFGAAVALAQDLLVVGAPQTDGGAGAAYVFTRIGDTWSLVQSLFPDPSRTASLFGQAVAVEGDVIVVGAPAEDTTAGTDGGAAYVFRKDGAVWVPEVKLVPDDGDAFDHFGTAVEVRSNRVLVGAPFAFVMSTYAGAVYAYVLDGDAWTFEERLVSADGGDGDGFGSSVVLAGETAVVGAPLDNGPPTDAGSAYVFERLVDTWAFRQKLLSPTPTAYARFGHSCSAGDGILLIGSPGDLDISATPGAVHVFAFDEVVWTFDRTLLAVDGAARDGFGLAVAHSTGRVVIGSPFFDVTGQEIGAAFAEYLGPVGLADFEPDGDTDMIDFAEFSLCPLGPSSAVPPACQHADLDGDDDVDLADVAAFQRALACGD